MIVRFYIKYIIILVNDNYNIIHFRYENDFK